jgi:hypothetical protein
MDRGQAFALSLPTNPLIESLVRLQISASAYDARRLREARANSCGPSRARPPFRRALSSSRRLREALRNTTAFSKSAWVFTSRPDGSSKTLPRSRIILLDMKALAVVVATLIVVSCSQELPTSPIQTAQKALPVTEAVRPGRVRAVAPPAGCVDVSGFYDVGYEGGCPTRGYLTRWELRQNGCEFFANINPDFPNVRGTVRGSTVNLLLRNGFTTCTYTLNGTGTVSNGVIRATVTGPTDGPCCGSGTDTVSLVATKR